MKIQLDTTQKTIKVENTVKLSELISALDKMFPNGEWKDYSLETNVTINNWSYPIYIKESPTYPAYPWYGGGVTNYSSDPEIKGTAGVYSVEF